MTDQFPSNKHPLLNRLRAMPGFTAAVVVFCLTVAMGAGGTWAYALWNQAATTAINVTTGAPNAVNMSCDDSAGDSATVSWDAAGARNYTYTVTDENGTDAGTGTGTSVVLDEGGLELIGISLGGSTTFTVQAYAHYGGNWTSTALQRIHYTAPFLGLGESADCAE